MNESDLFRTFAEAVARPVLSLTLAKERVFWGYLAGSAAIASVIWWQRLRARTSLFRFLLPASIWLHRSSLFDLRFMVVRALLSAFLFSALLVSSARLALSSKSTLASALGSSPLPLPSALGLGAITLLAFLAEDLARYVTHRLAHEVPELWALHQVHHSAEVLTPFTIYRAHPIDALLLRLSAAAALGVTVGAGAWLFDAPLSFVEIAGIHVLSLAWNALGSNLRHSHIWLSYPRFLALFLLSPAQHQIHHSVEARHHNRNFGSALSLWDRWFGTLHETDSHERLTFGISPNELNHQDRVLSALFLPLKDSLETFRRRFKGAGE